MLREDSYTDSLMKVMGIIKYNGCLIYRENGKFYVWGKPYDSLLKAQQKIDSSSRGILKSIQRGQRRLRNENDE